MKTYYRYNIENHLTLIGEEDEKIYLINSDGENFPCELLGKEMETPLIQQTFFQLQEYFQHRRKEFSLPLHFSGTPFQKRVYSALLDIPFGHTTSYKKIAEKVGSPLAYRAVGNTVNKNKIWIVVPCHRVIGSNGSLVGYAGGLTLKKELLDLEQNL